MVYNAETKRLTLPNGNVVECSGVDELREICHQLLEYARLLGHLKKRDKRRAIPAGELRGRYIGEKKRVVISIQNSEFRIRN